MSCRFLFPAISAEVLKLKWKQLVEGYCTDARHHSQQRQFRANCVNLVTADVTARSDQLFSPADIDRCLASRTNDLLTIFTLQWSLQRRWCWIDEEGSGRPWITKDNTAVTGREQSAENAQTRHGSPESSEYHSARNHV
ncbi:hypothetical protein RRG08_036722 [Elysia crispata]|uniref:Uncharacterized protein n=1 Tax=Elysia crispata TaxID=231223 RepID=A0AAE0XUQ5_9GAST|nr:hypothetical protein RRG08_036722 [Elysia crispata]